MTGKERLQQILARKSDTCGFWHGNSHETAAAQIYAAYGVNNEFELGVALGDTLRWVMADEHGAWQHPEGAPVFDVLGGHTRQSLGQDGVFAETTDVGEVENFPWPDTKYLNFDKTLAEIKKTQDAGQAVFSGLWSCFFHNVCDFFGMENYFIKMHTDPDVVLAVTRHVVEYYLAANEILFDLAGDSIDVFFFGNDFGSQLNLLISPECFDRFILPHVQEFVRRAKRRGYAVAHHSCGAIDLIIPSLIRAGVDIMHPIQAKAANMSAVQLHEKYGDRVVFMGGVDAQDILPFGTEEDIVREVARLKGIFGPNFIVSPSHESILPNIDPRKLEVLSKAALERHKPKPST